MSNARSTKTRSTRGFIVLTAGLFFAFVLAFVWLKSRPTATPTCSNNGGLGTIDGVCVGGYSIVASYDALPVANQRELFRLQNELPIDNKKGFVATVDSQGQLRVNGDWLYRTNVIVDVEAAASFDYPERWPAVQKFLRELGDPFYAEAKKKSPKGNKASCDPTNAWTLLKLREEPLRRCLRTMFLLDMTDTFNERTQKLFENQTMKYSNGTTGPLSLKREGLTDSDRGKVVSAVKAIDTKARALGGYH
jgi:hypothetical protein